MIIRSATGGAAAALALTLLLAPGLAAAQGLAAFNSDDLKLGATGNMQANGVLGGMAGSPTLDPQFGPNAQDAPPESTLTVRIYDPQMEYARGFAHLELGYFHEAAGDFEHAIEAGQSPDKGHSVDMSTLSTHPTKQPDKVAPRDSQFLMKCFYMLGVAKFGEGDLQGARAAYEQAMKIDSQQIAVRREYAVVLAKLGQADEAKAQLGMLKLRADACGDSCAQKDDFKAAVARIQAALAGTLSAPG